MLRRILSGVARWFRERWSELKKWRKKAPESEKVGVLVWSVMGVFIAWPELWAVGKSCEFPYPTISTTVGHLQDKWPVVALIPVALIVMPAYFVFYLPPSKPPYVTRRHIHFRTREGRRAKVEFRSYDQLEALPTSEAASQNPLVLAQRTGIRWRRYFVAAAIVCGGSWGIIVLSQREGLQSENRYLTGYVLYSLIAVFWVIVPSVAASLFKKDVSFTTLAYTIGILGRRIPILAALTAALLMILLLHLAFYPWPSPSPDDPPRNCNYSPGSDTAHARTPAFLAWKVDPSRST